MPNAVPLMGSPGRRAARARAASVVVALLALAACDHTPSGPAPVEPGSILVVVRTTAVGVGPFTILLDGDRPGLIWGNGFAGFEDVGAGEHVVRLTGLASDCAVQDRNPVTIVVTPGGLADVAFTILCGAERPTVPALRAARARRRAER